MSNNKQIGPDEGVQVEKQTIFKEESPTAAREKQPTMSGLDENIAGLLCYLFSLISGIVFLIIEKENKFIRFHAMQAIMTFIVVVGASLLLGLIPFIGFIISLLIAPITFFLFVFLMYQAYQGKMYKLPFLGDLAEKHSAPSDEKSV